MTWITALTCLVIPLLILIVARKAYLDSQQRKLLRTQHPTEPWLWRTDWSSRTATDQAHRSVALLWFFAFLWNAISLPVFFVLRDRAARDPFMYFMVLFPVAGVIVICVALYLTLRRRKYGLSVCRFDELPIPIGQMLRGEIATRVGDVPQDGFNLRLTSVRRVVTGSGKSTSVRETILWQEEQRVGAGAAMPTANGVRVPFRFAIPADAEPADDRNPRDRVIWRLQVTADVPGIDYSAAFELPVFATDDAVEVARDRFVPSGASWTPPPSMQFSVSPTGGEEVTIKPASRIADWVGYVAFLILWFGALAFIYRLGGPLFAVIFFGVAGLVVMFIAIDFLIGKSVIAADRSQMTYRRTFAGTSVVPAVEIDAIASRIGSTSGGRALYDLEARLHDGRSLRIARNLPTRRDAENLAARLMRSMGR